ncbi:hypothetical protein [Paraburkholderia sp. SIMBA_054]|uniref:hypothetical protein n=1 Tax=Paraburkholderia sp. SIMBA_054 TaxID=3085795 RepID=UPI00397C9794
MYVDPRVAHARARLVLSERAVNPSDLDAKVAGIVSASLYRGKGTLSLREFRRRVETSLATALRGQGFGFDVLIDTSPDKRYGFLARITVADAINGLRGVSYSMMWGEPGVQIGEWLTIAPHAVARCLQRNGSLRLSDIRYELMCASAMALPMAYFAQELGWKQVFVRTPAGLFVGDWGGTGMVLRTYFQPGLNGRSSKWTQISELLPGLPAEPMTQDELDGFARTLVGWLRANRAAIEMHSAFLREPHQRVEDHLDAAWQDKSLAA